MVGDRLDLIDALDGLDPGPDEVATAELVVSDDVLVKGFALGPGAELDRHEHDCTNVFHVLEGTVTVLRDDDAEPTFAPAVVHHEPGQPHGARNDTDEVVRFTASLCPMPGA